MPEPPPLPKGPPPLPAPTWPVAASAVAVLPYAGPVPPDELPLATQVLDYRVRPGFSPQKSERLLLFGGIGAGLIGLAVLAGMIDVLVDTWPNFGMMLVAAPVSLVSLAFLSVSYTAFRGMRVDAN